MFSILKKFLKKLNNRIELAKWLPSNGIVAEIGTMRGEFAKTILQYANPERLHLIDAWEYQNPNVYPSIRHPKMNSSKKQNDNYAYVLERFEEQIKNGKVVVHKGYSDNVLKKFPDAHFDWVYIDGNHQYEYVKNDLEICRKKTKKEGYICGHDYCEGNHIRGEKYGVIRAVDEFLNKYDYEIICLADHLWKGINFQSYVLSKK